MSRRLIVWCQTRHTTCYANTVQGTGNGAVIRQKRMSQTTCCCPKAYRTRGDRWQNKTYIIMAGSSAYKGWTRPRLVTPHSSSEWTPTSILSLLILVNQVHPNPVLFLTGPGLTQLQVTDLSVGPGGFKSPFAETPFHSSHLNLLFKEIDLATQCLALLVHGVVTVNFGHKTPIVDSEFVELLPKGSKGGATPPQGG